MTHAPNIVFERMTLLSLQSHTLKPISANAKKLRFSIKNG